MNPETAAPFPEFPIHQVWEGGSWNLHFCKFPGDAAAVDGPRNTVLRTTVLACPWWDGGFLRLKGRVLITKTEA